jgi:hypothetical protein
LAEVQKDPTLLDGLSLTVIVALRRQVSHLAADLDAAFSHAMTQPRTQDPRSEADPDRTNFSCDGNSSCRLAARVAASAGTADRSAEVGASPNKSAKLCGGSEARRSSEVCVSQVSSPCVVSKNFASRPVSSRFKGRLSRWRMIVGRKRSSSRWSSPRIELRDDFPESICAAVADSPTPCERCRVVDGFAGSLTDDAITGTNCGTPKIAISGTPSSGTKNANIDSEEPD